MVRMTSLASLLFLLCASAAALSAQEPATPSVEPAKLKQFIYVLRLVPRLHDDKAWTKDDEAIVGRHFAHIKAAYERGQATFVGRTMEPGDKTFGLVVFTAEDEAAARKFMESDPSVVEGIMTAEVHPFAVVLGAPPVKAAKE